MLDLVFKLWESTGGVIRPMDLVGRVVEESLWGLLWGCDPEVEGAGRVGRSHGREVTRKLLFHHRDGEVARARRCRSAPELEESGTPAQVSIQGGELGQAQTRVVAQLGRSLWGCLPDGESPISLHQRSHVGDPCR